MNIKYEYIVFYIIFLYNIPILCEITCRNENNEYLDWFVAIKHPKSYNFVYLSSANADSHWKESNYDLRSEKNLIAITLQQSYLHCNTKCFYIYYNDDRPLSNSSTKGGHLKGILNMDDSTGYWLTHSVPNFPMENEYFFNKAQSIYGQSFMCVSIKNTYLKPIVQQLLMMQATIYSSFYPTSFTNDMELISLLPRLIKNIRSKNLVSNILHFKTLNSMNLLHFAKSPKYDQDLYSKLIAPTLNGSLFVETWRNGRGSKLDSACELKYKVNNVEEINLSNKSFKSTSDHSKWAISQSKSSPYICIGDINRMESQFKRGGGSLCTSNVNIWEKFYKSIKTYEKC